MKKSLWISFIILILSSAGFVISNSGSPRSAQKNFKNSSVGGADNGIKYNPPLPEDAPESIRNEVMLGFKIMDSTKKYAGEYVGNKLNCSNCHFNGGITKGGKNGGLSLVGVATEYPKYRSRAKAVVDIVFRTNSCFERSMNGKALPQNSRQMVALVTYFQWISRGLPIYQKLPWLGLKHINSRHKPDGLNGEKIFASTCAACHGTAGQGTQAAPPLWGHDSFNDGAGMSHLANLAAFAHNNMPYHISNLTENQSLDVAAYVAGRPRPHFTSK